MNNAKKKGKVRDRFSRAATGSSRGFYVYISHILWLEENHKEVEKMYRKASRKKRYFVKVFGRLVEVTEREALMLGRNRVIVK